MIMSELLRSIVGNVNTWIGKKTVRVTDLAPMETSLLNSKYYNSILQIRVKRCRDVFWYQYHIGKTFVVIYQDTDRWWVKEPDEFGFLNFILKVDAEII